MKLQLALDELKLEEALIFAEKVQEHVDIIEIGTPFVIDSGMEAVRRFKAKFPDKEILSDEKLWMAAIMNHSWALKRELSMSQSWGSPMLLQSNNV